MATEKAKKAALANLKKNAKKAMSTKGDDKPSLMIMIGLGEPEEEDKTDEE